MDMILINRRFLSNWQGNKVRKKAYRGSENDASIAFKKKKTEMLNSDDTRLSKLEETTRTLLPGHLQDS